MRFNAKQRAGRQESEKLEDIGITYQKKTVLILTININMGGKRVKSLQLKERNCGCSETEWWRVQCGLPHGV